MPLSTPLQYESKVYIFSINGHVVDSQTSMASLKRVWLVVAGITIDVYFVSNSLIVFFC
jgi:hypothetical protein